MRPINRTGFGDLLPTLRKNPINCRLRRSPPFTRFLDDGRVCVTSNAAECALRGVTLGPKSRLFCGSDRGGQCAAVMCSLVAAAKLGNVDRQA